MLNFIANISSINHLSNIYLSESGDDSNNGSTQSTAWKTIDKLNANISLLAEGSSVFFNGGDDFIGSIDLTTASNGSLNNPIIFDSYGTGNATIRGDEEVSGFTNIGGDIWEVDTNGNSANFVLKNQELQQICRYPKYQGKYAFNSHYAIYTFTSQTDFTVLDFKGLTNLVGAKLIFTSRDWVFEQRTITAFNSTTGDLTIDSSPFYTLGTGHYCFVIGAESLLTTQDEWYYDDTAGKLRIYSTIEPTNISIIPTDNNGIDFTGKEYYTFKNLKVNAHSKHGLFSNGLDDSCIIDNCEISNCGSLGIFAYYGIDSEITNNEIHNCLSGGILTWKSKSVNRNYVHDVCRMNLATGMPENDIKISNQLSWFGISVWGQNNGSVYLNKVIDVGYIGIRPESGAFHVYKNYVENGGLELTDGGAIYSYNINREYSNSGTIIENNICIQYPLMISSRKFSGIYLDEGSDGVTVRNNVAIGFYYNILEHKCLHNTITGNNLYKSSYNSMYLLTSQSLLINDNKMYQETDRFILNMSNLQSYQLGGLGTLDNNRYFNPTNNIAVAISGNYIADGERTLPDWQAYSSEDLNSTDDAGLIITDSACHYNDTESIIVQVLVGTWYDLDGNSYSGSVNINPYESIILIQY